MNTYTLTDALAHHGVTVTDADIARRMALRDMTYGAAHTEALTDEARERGVIRVCLGCATVVAVADGTPEYDRVSTRDAIDWDSAPCDSLPVCEDADTVLF